MPKLAMPPPGSGMCSAERDLEGSVGFAHAKPGAVNTTGDSRFLILHVTLSDGQDWLYPVVNGFLTYAYPATPEGRAEMYKDVHEMERQQ